MIHYTIFQSWTKYKNSTRCLSWKVLVVNIATGWFNAPVPRTSELDRYQEQGFEILDFPCNQFMDKHQVAQRKLNAFCSLHYQTTFPRFAKIKVNREEADPLCLVERTKSAHWENELNGISAKFLSVVMVVFERFSSKQIQTVNRQYKNYYISLTIIGSLS